MPVIVTAAPALANAWAMSLPMRDAAGDQDVGAGGHVEGQAVHFFVLSSLIDLVSQAFFQKFSVSASSASCASIAAARAPAWPGR